MVHLAPLVGRCLTCRCVIAAFVLSSWQAQAKDEKKSKSDDSGQPPDSQQAMPGSSKYWTNLLGLGFSEGTLEPTFTPDHGDYKLTIKSGKASELLVTPTINVAKYDLLYKPKLIFNGVVQDYSPILNIEFVYLLNKSFAPLSDDITLEVSDPDKPMDKPLFGVKNPFAKTYNSKTYTIHVTQAPDIEKIVTATDISINDANTGKRFYAHPRYSPESPRNEITYVVGEDTEKVSVTVTCPAEATGLKYNGILQDAGSSYISNAIEGASKSVLGQCLYKNKKWTNNEEMQRTYVITIQRNAKLKGTDVSLRIWPPDKGKCNHIKDKDGHLTDPPEFFCMSRFQAVPLLGAYDNNKAELDVYDEKKGAKYRLWNGIPTTVAVPEHHKDDVLLLQAGTHNRSFKLELRLTPTCLNLQCPERWTNNATSVRGSRCNWTPCNLKDDFSVCCAKYRMPCGNAKPGLFNCPKKKIVAPLNKCAWTPCLKKDEDTCCVDMGDNMASCSTMKCPPDYVHTADAPALTCTQQPCGGATDQKMCCVQRAICNTMTCPDGFTKKYNAALYLCEGEKCMPTDRDTCCNAASYCDSWTCPPAEWMPKPNAKTIPCGGNPCMEWDTGYCCNKKGFCSTMKCPHGYYAKPGNDRIPCAGMAQKACSLKEDLNTCCLPAGQCMNSYVCSRGWEPKLNARSISCLGAACTDKDRGICCDMTNPFEAADDVVVAPIDGKEGKCEMQDATFNWVCQASTEKLRLHVIYKFNTPVTTEIFIGGIMPQGRTATITIPPLDVPKDGQKRYNYHTTAQVAGRGQAHSMLHIWVSKTKDDKKSTSVSTDAKGSTPAGTLTSVSEKRKLKAPDSSGAVHTSASALVALALALAPFWGFVMTLLA